MRLVKYYTSCPKMNQELHFKYVRNTDSHKFDIFTLGIFIIELELQTIIRNTKMLEASSVFKRFRELRNTYNGNNGTINLNKKNAYLDLNMDTRNFIEEADKILSKDFLQYLKVEQLIKYILEHILIEKEERVGIKEFNNWFRVNISNSRLIIL